MKLSIIIPAYNAEPYIDELLKALAPQINPEVEVIVVDDGSRMPYIPSYDWAKVIRQNNGGVSSARNRGLDEAQGEYIAFIDADDLVTSEYIEKIFQKIEDKPDYIYLSWRTFGSGWKYSVELKTIEDNFPAFNLCVWNRVFKRTMIGKARFNLKKLIAEDADFLQQLDETGKKKAFIPECVYLYRTGHGGNLTERFNNGEIDFKRIVYYYPEITIRQTNLLSEILSEMNDSEVIVMTNRCELPLDKYVMVIKPQRIAGTELRGCQTELFRKIERPIRTQVVLYVGNAQSIGGIETFMYNFCREMSEYYDITVVYSQNMDARQVVRLSQVVEVMKNPKKIISCDTLINIRITDEVPSNIKYGRLVQMVHICQMAKSGKYHYNIVKGWNDIVFVSDTAYKTYLDQVKDGLIIPNLTDKTKPKKALQLVSATRLTYEKGEERMYKLAEALRNENIPFIWLVFSPTPLRRVIPGVVQCPTTLDVRSFFLKADYIVQLSDQEAFCYTIAEALELGKPVLTTDLPVLKELGFENEKHGYILDWDMSDIKVNEIYTNIPKFKPLKSRNPEIVKKWRDLLGDTVPTRSYKPCSDMINVVVTESYIDKELGRTVNVGEVLTVRIDRAMMLINRGLASKT